MIASNAILLFILFQFSIKWPPLICSECRVPISGPRLHPGAYHLRHLQIHPVNLHYYLLACKFYLIIISINTSIFYAENNFKCFIYTVNISIELFCMFFLTRICKKKLLRPGWKQHSNYKMTGKLHLSNIRIRGWVLLIDI